MIRLPGTIIETEENNARQVFTSIFSTGGVTLSQVCNITELETYVIQNWVKRGYIASPTNKKYDVNQLCRIIIVNILKDVFSIEQVCGILEAASRCPDVDDSKLYFLFVDVVFFSKSSMSNFENAIAEIKPKLGNSKAYEKHLCAILKIMFTAYVSKKHKQDALSQYKSLGISEKG